MDARDRATLVAGRGVEGSADRGGKRQVSILAREAWEEACARAGAPARLDPSARRANLLVSGLALEGTRGRVLVAGPCRLRVLGELTPCERMDEAWPGLDAALREGWRGGVFAEVLAGGELGAGDAIAFEPAAG